MLSVALKNNLVLVLLLFVSNSIFAQKKSDQLQAEQARLENKLNTTKGLLEKVKKGTQLSMNELKLIENQVRDREQLVQNVDNQIRGAELSISSKSNQVKQLQEKLVRMKAQYRSMLLYAYKHRSKHGKMMYIFSASNYFEAVKRTNYLKRIAEIQNKQFKIILQSQKSIHKEINSIQEQKSRQLSLLETKIAEKERILKDKQEKERALAKLKKDENKLRAELQAAEKKKAELKRRIKQAIDKEIAESEAKAKKEQKKAESKSTASTAKKTETKSTSSETKTAEKKPVVVTETKESAALGKSFESNRGKLPWPVLKGTIVEGYGKNPHPTLANVYTNNNGIDIGAPKGAQVRSVFEGEVTSVLNIPGAGKVVIIKHGNYRTVYSNLQEVFVAVGSKVNTKQAIGSLLPDDGGGLSTAHFEIHQVVEGSVQRMNPTLWLAQ